MLNWFFNKSNRASGPITVADYGIAAMRWLLGPTVIAWLSTTYEWYWQTFKLAGVAFAFLVAWLALGLGVFLIGHGMAAWRKSEQNPEPRPEAMTSDAAPALPEWLSEIPSRLDDLSAELNDFARTVNGNRKLEEERYSNLGSSNTVLSNHLGAFSARLREVEETLTPKTTGNPIFELGIPEHEKFKNRLDAIESSIKSIKSSQNKVTAELGKVLEETKALGTNHHQLHDKMRETFRARDVERTMDKLLAWIDGIDKRLSEPTNNPDFAVNWNEWNHLYEQWKAALFRLAQETYKYHDLREKLFEIPRDAYKDDKWTVNFSRFPDNNQIVDYKEFRMTRQNLESLRQGLVVSVRNAARV